jgi:hypothetical protein
VAADEVAAPGDPPGRVRVRLDPAALEEEGRPDVTPLELVEQPLLEPRLGRPVGMFGVEGQGDAQAAYLSTPVMTMPRTNARWKTTNRRTGMMSVIMLPAWMNAGF